MCPMKFSLKPALLFLRPTYAMLPFFPIKLPSPTPNFHVVASAYPCSLLPCQFHSKSLTSFLWSLHPANFVPCQPLSHSLTYVFISYPTHVLYNVPYHVPSNPLPCPHFSFLQLFLLSRFCKHLSFLVNIWIPNEVNLAWDGQDQSVMVSDRSC